MEGAEQQKDASTLLETAVGTETKSEGDGLQDYERRAALAEKRLATLELKFAALVAKTQ